MEGQFQTSFIPKRPLVQKTPGTPRRKVNFFLLIMIVILVTVVALAVAVFAYDIILKNKSQNYADKLSKTVAELQPNLITTLNRLDTRITSTKSLLNQHMSLSSFFAFLNNHTVQSIRFTSFTYTYTGSKVSVSMKGEASNFSAIAIQSNEFNRPENALNLRNPVFSSLALDKSGNVTFSFNADLDPSLYSYSKKVAAPNTAPTTPQPMPVILPPSTTTVPVAPLATTTVTTTTKTATTTKTTAKTTTVKKP